MKHPIENWFRPPVEFVPATISALSAITVSVAPAFFALPGQVALGISVTLVAHSGWRLRQGLRITKFHSNLRRLPVYVCSADDIPWSREKLFLGMGFRWGQEHTQRLVESRHPKNRQFVEPGKLYHLAREWELKVEGNRWEKQIKALLRRDVWWNPAVPLPPVGGDTAIHGVEPAEKKVWMDLGERVGHVLVLGTTRVGKTRLAEVLITQDIRRGDVVIVFDPKGDADLLRRMYAEAKRSGRDKQFYMFHLGHPELSARYNPVGTFSKVTEVATRIAGQLPGEGQSAAFKEFVWRFVNVIARALVALGRKPDYAQITRYGTDVEPLLVDYYEFWLAGNPEAIGWEAHVASFEQEMAASGGKGQPKNMVGRSNRAQALLKYVKEFNLFDPIAHALGSTFAYDKTYFDKLVASLLPLMEKLTTGKVAQLISPDYMDMLDDRPIFEWQSIINNGGIVYVGLDSLSDHEVASAIGNSMFADLTSVAGQLYKYGQGAGLPGAPKPRKIAIHADEFNELIGDEFIPLLNKAGGANYQVTAYTQTWSDVEAKIGSPAKAGQIGGNFNTLIMLRVKNIETAEILTNQLPECDLYNLTPATSVNDTADPRDFADFSSRNEDAISVEKVPMLQPADLVQLPKGQAFALIEGGRLFKIRMPLPQVGNDVHMPADLEQLAQQMGVRYADYVKSVEPDAA